MLLNPVGHSRIKIEEFWRYSRQCNKPWTSSCSNSLLQRLACDALDMVNVSYGTKCFAVYGLASISIPSDNY